MRAPVVVVAGLVTIGCAELAPSAITRIADTVVINYDRPVQIPVRGFDAAGAAVPVTDARYRWLSGVPVSAAGTVTCRQRGEAIVRITTPDVTSNVVVLCRPVHDIRATRMLDLIAGDPAQEIPFEAVDTGGQPVTVLAGQIVVGDSSIATVDGRRVRAHRAGVTDLSVRLGNREGYMSVHSYERAESPEGMKVGQHYAVAVRVARRDTIRWRLDPGMYMLSMLPNRDGRPRPGFAIEGANCTRVLAPDRYGCLARQEWSLTVYHPDPTISVDTLGGTLVIWRQEDP